MLFTWGFSSCLDIGQSLFFLLQNSSRMLWVLAVLHCASQEGPLSKVKMRSFLFRRTCLYRMFTSLQMSIFLEMFSSHFPLWGQLMMVACEWHDVCSLLCPYIGPVYTFSYWIDVPESQDAHWPCFCPGQGHTQHPLPHAAPCSVRI